MKIAFAVLFTSVFLITGCQNAPIPEEVVPEIPLATPVLQLDVGTCVNDSDTPLSADLAEVPEVPCSEPHDSELYAIRTVDDGAYPGADVLIREGQSYCQDRFAGFVGIDFRSSLLDFYFYYPTPSSWAAGDRLIYCMVFDPGLKVIGTLEGANR
jgi:hypothetical protein